jgi:MFS family permease
LDAKAQTGRPGSVRLVAFASLIGTTIEWYDFFLYGTAAALVFNRLYFPTFDPRMGTLAAFGTYTVGFVARPIGGAIIGHYGDKIGRKSMLILTLVIMGVATFGIGLLPTYKQIGPWAAVALVVLRLAQGFGVGGEWGGAVLMAVEHRAAWPPWLLRQLAANRRACRSAVVDGGVRAVCAPAGRAVSCRGVGAFHFSSALCWSLSVY